jgi:hypothetical protein
MRRFVGQMSLLPVSNLIMLLTGNLCNRFGHVAPGKWFGRLLPAQRSVPSSFQTKCRSPTVRRSTRQRSAAVDARSSTQSSTVA